MRAEALEHSLAEAGFTGVDMVDAGLARDVEVLDVTHDSRRVAPGSLFCAVPGLTVDGHDFVAQAVADGAVAALVERHLDIDTIQFQVPSVRQAMPWAAAAVHGHPSRRLAVFGITGTNGKTTTTKMLADIMSHVGRRVDVIGTLAGQHTTPEAPDLQRRFRDAVADGVDVIAAEISSHALEQGRADATEFAVAAFSNLTPDHLDYHGSMDAYFEAKQRLFDGRARHELINVDDPWGRRLAAMRPAAQHVSTEDVEVLASDLNGTTFAWRGHEAHISIPGAMNVANALMAAEAARLLGVDDGDIAAAMRHVGAVDGRMQVVDGRPDQPTVIVDYSHTPDSIERALQTIRNAAPSATVTIVFGCGGDRDRTKRPLMTEAALAAADRVVLTNDNPRTEAPEAIVDDALRGIRDRERVIVELDRRAAIAMAIGDASADDVVLLAGKGHERTQTIGTEKFPFDDVEVARITLEELAR